MKKFNITEFLRNPKPVYEALNHGAVEITRRDKDSLIVITYEQYMKTLKGDNDG